MAFKDYLAGQWDAQQGMWRPTGNLSYQLGHDAESRSRSSTNPTGAYTPAGARVEAPAWLKKVAKWTAVLGLVMGSVGGFLVSNTPQIGLQTLLLTSGVGLVGFTLGWLLPFVIVGSVVVLYHLIIGILWLAAICAAAFVLGCAVYAAIAYISG